MKTPENLQKNWWWIVLCAILFASLGNLLTVMLPARYTQSADIQVLFKQSAEMDWSDKTMLQVTEAMGSLVDDMDTQAEVLWQLRHEGYALDEKDFSQLASKERRFYGWKLIVTSNDSLLTETFLRIWQTVVFEAINADLEKSQKTQRQSELAELWIPCLQQLPAEPIHAFCNPQNAAQIAANYNEVFAQYEKAKSQVKYLIGFPPTYSAHLLTASSIERVSMVSRNSAILIGTLIGLLIGTLTIESPWTQHLNFRRGES